MADILLSALASFNFKVGRSVLKVGFYGRLTFQRFIKFETIRLAFKLTSDRRCRLSVLDLGPHEDEEAL
jgi:hypothetical protein